MKNKRQHARPIHISGFDSHASVRVLKPISLVRGDSDTEHYDESWLQKLIFDHPKVLPVEEIEPAFAPLYPVCMEMATEAGYVDNLYVSENGGLTLVECKLWRNPQARREVVGQILDYAKVLSKWSYEDLDKAVSQGSSSQNRLFDVIAEKVEDLDEARFVDAVSKNLNKGRFLLLIVGDGIREGVENIVNFLQAHAGLDFTFGLIELGLFSMPDGDGILVQPRTIAQTYSIERAVITVEQAGVMVKDPVDQKVTHKQAGRRTTISEDEFYEQLDQNEIGVSANLKDFIEELAELEIYPSYGSSSLNLHWSPEGSWKMNFGFIRVDGLVNTDPANWQTDFRLGRVDIGHDYQERLAHLVPGATVAVRKTEKQETRKVVIGNQLVPIIELLKVGSQWRDLMDYTKKEIIKAMQ